MSRLTVNLPDDVHAQLQQLAESEGVSVSEYMAYAIAHPTKRQSVEALPESSFPDNGAAHLWPTTHDVPPARRV